MATKLKDLQIDDAHATAVLEKAIEYESFSEDMPASKRERIKAATEQITMMVDAWVNDGVTPENEDEEVAAVGTAIEEIFEIVGVEIDEDGGVSYVDPAELDDPVSELDDADNEGDDEAAVDINDIIDGYDDLSAAGKVKAIKGLELDMDDDDDYNTAVALYEYEEAQDQPSSRVLTYLDDVIPPEDEGAAEDEEPEDEGAEPEEEDGEAEEGEWEQPWDKYDKQTAVEVKKQLDKLLAREELTSEMLQYVIEYEEQREKPPPRKRIIDYATKLMGDLEEPEADEEPPARAARPSAATRMRGSSRRRGARAADPDDNDDADDAVARDDAKESRRGRRVAASNGSFTLTREMVLEALENGEVEIPV